MELILTKDMSGMNSMSMQYKKKKKTLAIADSVNELKEIIQNFIN